MLEPTLVEEEKQRYMQVFQKYPKLFATEYCQLRGTKSIVHHIDLKEGAKLVVQKLRRMTTIQRDVLKQEVMKLLEADFIYPVYDSEWVSPVVIIAKKNGKWAVCVDFRPLNAWTKRDHYPLPFQD